MESLACGLAVASAELVITSNVLEEPREPQARPLELAATLAQRAAIVISRR
jgi:hypothetical protein